LLSQIAYFPSLPLKLQTPFCKGIFCPAGIIPKTTWVLMEARQRHAFCEFKPGAPKGTLGIKIYDLPCVKSDVIAWQQQKPKRFFCPIYMQRPLFKNLSRAAFQPAKSVSFPNFLATNFSDFVLHEPSYYS